MSRATGSITETFEKLAENFKNALECLFGNTNITTLDEGIRQRKKRVYIAGPMSGKKDFNRASFFKAAASIKEEGYNWIPVHAAWQEDGELYKDYMRQALQLLLSCDSIILLSGWRHSEGAMIEYKIAKACGMKIMEMKE